MRKKRLSPLVVFHSIHFIIAGKWTSAIATCTLDLLQYCIQLFYFSSTSHMESVKPLFQGVTDTYCNSIMHFQMILTNSAPLLPLSPPPPLL